MTLYLVGLGLWDEKDISVRGKEIVDRCDKVYLESYTSILFGTDLEKLKNFFGKEIIPLNRHEVEVEKKFLSEAKEKDIALLVGGDPLSATTHFEILSEAKEKGIKCEIIHSSSIFTAVAESGLFLYRFGKTVSIPFWEENYQPKSFVEIIKKNLENDSHTLVLLDLRPEENKFMSPNYAMEILLKSGITEDTEIIVLSRLGSPNKSIRFGRIKDLIKMDFGSPLHALIIPSLNEIEREFLRQMS